MPLDRLATHRTGLFECYWEVHIQSQLTKFVLAIFDYAIGGMVIEIPGRMVCRLGESVW